MIRIKLNASKNKVRVNPLSKKNVEKLESNLNFKDASFSENSDIIDVHGIMINFVTDIENKGEISCIFK